MNDTKGSEKVKHLKDVLGDSIAGRLLGDTSSPAAEQAPTNLEAEEKKIRSEELLKLLKEHRGEHHLIVLHAYPDPDAISTAYAHLLISGRYSISVDIIYPGEISHPQNQALVRLLGSNYMRFSPEIDLDKYQGVVYLDHQGNSVEEISALLKKKGLPLLAVIDHHQSKEHVKASFVDIRHTGAVATIYAGYLEEGALQMDSAILEHRLAATALMHGILTDTQDFLRAGAEDFAAAVFLSRYRDADQLIQLVQQKRSKHSMDLIQRALVNRSNVENFSLAGVGFVRSEDRDAIPQAAEFLLSEENVHTAIVYGIVTDQEGEETLIGSLRTSKIDLDPDKFMKEVFGQDESGRFYGGGRPLAGGFAVPVGFLTGTPDEDYREIKWQVYDAQVQQRLFSKIGVAV